MSSSLVHPLFHCSRALQIHSATQKLDTTIQGIYPLRLLSTTSICSCAELRWPPPESLHRKADGLPVSSDHTMAGFQESSSPFSSTLPREMRRLHFPVWIQYANAQRAKA